MKITADVFVKENYLKDRAIDGILWAGFPEEEEFKYKLLTQLTEEHVYSFGLAIPSIQFKEGSNEIKEYNEIEKRFLNELKELTIIAYKEVSDLEGFFKGLVSERHDKKNTYKELARKKVRWRKEEEKKKKEEWEEKKKQSPDESFVKYYKEQEELRIKCFFDISPCTEEHYGKQYREILECFQFFFGTAGEGRKKSTSFFLYKNPIETLMQNIIIFYHIFFKTLEADYKDIIVGRDFSKWSTRDAVTNYTFSWGRENGQKFERKNILDIKEEKRHFTEVVILSILKRLIGINSRIERYRLEVLKFMTDNLHSKH